MFLIVEAVAAYEAKKSALEKEGKKMLVWHTVKFLKIRTP